jgi:dimethylargininase
MKNVAITRAISSSIDRCELSHEQRQAIDLGLATRQLSSFEQILAHLGCEVLRLPALDNHPDSVFVDDTAIVLDELAVITRPGAESRRGEVGTIAEALRPWRRLVRLEEPCTLDGGDVLRVDRTLYVGRSGRTNQAGIDQLARETEPLGYRVRPVDLSGCLHLKAAVGLVAPGAVLLNPARVDRDDFEGLVTLEVAPDEPDAANTLLLGGHILMPKGQPNTVGILDSLGVPIIEIDLGELTKAESGLSGCTLVFRAASGG